MAGIRGHVASGLFEALTLTSSGTSIPSTIPTFLYGCAWKKAATDKLVYEAINTGFKGVDVAAQPRHYREDLVGEGLRRVYAEGKIKRGDLFIQTKFSPISAHDPKNIPYDAKASVTEQVKQSVSSSLRNLRHGDGPEESGTYLDSLVLHSPLPSIEETLEAWKACEAYVPNTIKYLGISNTTLPILKVLYDRATIKPAVVQNRFVRDTHYEQALRQWCASRGIVYQSFWTLTANPHLLNSRPIVSFAKAANVDPAVALYGAVLALGNTIILNGTVNHMKHDLDGIERVKEWALGYPDEFENTMKQFKSFIGENEVPEDDPHVN